MAEAPSVAMSQADWFRANATAAAERSRVAGEAGGNAEALRWIERAHRIAPSDPGIGLAVAIARIRVGELRSAADLLRSLAARQDSREIWFTLASLQHRMRDAAAAVTLGRALSAHALPAAGGVWDLADGVAGGPGWCGCGEDGVLVVRQRGPGSLRIEVDGVAVRAGRRRILPGTRVVSVSVDGRALLGSPLRIDRINRIEGFVAATGEGLAGWAWHPGAPDRDPVVVVRSAGGDALRVTARDQNILAGAALARPRRFQIAARRLAGMAGPFTVSGLDGGALLGSPLDLGAPLALPAAVAATPPRPQPDRPVAVVVPVYGQGDIVSGCLTSVLATLPRGCRVIVVDDASPEAETLARVTAVIRAAGGRRVTVLRHAINRGFPAAVNTGLRAVLALRRRHDVVLLNSDTLVPPGWVEGLRDLVHARPDAGTVTPLSNDATILSYPAVDGGNVAPGAGELARWAGWAAAANSGVAVEIPTAVGFCMYIRHECLAGTGMFREDVFAQGYGEENDFCRRASAAGWRHLAAPGVFVAHLGGQSFGAARGDLIARNLDILERLHPGYHAGIAAFQRRDPLAAARRRFDATRWRDGGMAGGAVLLITHASGGGVERVVRERSAAIRAAGMRPVVLRSVIARTGVAAYVRGLCQIEEGDAAGGFPNLCFSLPREIGALARLVRADRPVRIEVHHLVGHHHDVITLGARLGVPIETHVHDYAGFCPRISLVGRHGRYCGEPADPAECDACVAAVGRSITDTLPAAALRARTAADLAASRRIVVPSVDAAQRLRRHFPAVVPEVTPLEDDGGYPPLRGFAGPPRHIGIIGGIGVEKGYDILLACARDAAARGLNLHFTVIGHTSDDEPLLDTGRVFVTGPYREAEAVALIRAQDIQLAWQPSIWPETWCFTLGLAWRAGLAMAAFDIGAPAERIRRTGRGWLMPLGLPPAAINSVFLGLRPGPGVEITP